MKIVVHDIMKNTQRVFEGDPITMERELEEAYPWAVHGNHGDLETTLWTLDHAQTFAVEVVDPLPHPFLKG